MSSPPYIKEAASRCRKHTHSLSNMLTPSPHYPMGELREPVHTSLDHCGGVVWGSGGGLEKYKICSLSFV